MHNVISPKITPKYSITYVFNIDTDYIIYKGGRL